MGEVGGMREGGSGGAGGGDGGDAEGELEGVGRGETDGIRRHGRSCWRGVGGGRGGVSDEDPRGDTNTSAASN